MRSLCRARHPDAEGLVEEGNLVGPEELGVRVDALVKTVDPLHFDRLHGVVAGHWRQKKQQRIGSKKCFCALTVTQLSILFPGINKVDQSINQSITKEINIFVLLLWGLTRSKIQSE